MYLNGIIYKITNTINQKVYIGQTIATLKTRWNSHVYESKRDKLNFPIYRAIRKYGVNNFIIEEIDFSNNIDELNLKETFHILKNKSNKPKYGYNCDTGGNNKTVNDETKFRMKKPKSEKTKQKMRHSKSEEGRKNIEAAQKKRAKIKIQCENCNKKVNDINYKRWHGDNCGKNRTWNKQLGKDAAKKLKNNRSKKYTGIGNPMYGKKRRDVSERNKKIKYTGDKNGMSKTIIINGVAYGSMAEATRITGISYYIIRKNYL